VDTIIAGDSGVRFVLPRKNTAKIEFPHASALLPTPAEDILNWSLFVSGEEQGRSAAPLPRSNRNHSGAQGFVSSHNPNARQFSTAAFIRTGHTGRFPERF
jgi:hypothetical protein